MRLGPRVTGVLGQLAIRVDPVLEGGRVVRAGEVLFKFPEVDCDEVRVEAVTIRGSVMEDEHLLRVADRRAEQSADVGDVDAELVLGGLEVAVGPDRLEDCRRRLAAAVDDEQG